MQPNSPHYTRYRKKLFLYSVLFIGYTLGIALFANPTSQKATFSMMAGAAVTLIFGLIAMVQAFIAERAEKKNKPSNHGKDESK